MGNNRLIVDNGVGLDIKPANIIILDDNYRLEDIKLDGNWYRLDRFLVREGQKKNWFHRNMLKYFFGIDYIRGDK